MDGCPGGESDRVAHRGTDGEAGNVDVLCLRQQGGSFLNVRVGELNGAGVALSEIYGGSERDLRGCSCGDWKQEGNKKNLREWIAREICHR